MPGSLFRVALLTLLLNVGFVCAGRAQRKIPLDSIDKITFVRKGYILSREYLKVEVIPEKSLWKAYRVEQRKEWEQSTDDLSRLYVKDIPASTVAGLTSIIAGKDTSFRIGRLGIDRQRAIDSVLSRYPAFSDQQLIEYAKIINSDAVFSKWVRYVIDHPMFSDDPTHYYIMVSRRSGKVDTLQAHANISLDLLPWRVNGWKCFDPMVTRIYSSVMGEEQGIGTTTDYVKYVEAAFQIYQKELQCKFNWEDIRVNYPIAYKALSKDIEPITIGAIVREKAAPGVNKGYNFTTRIKGLRYPIKLKFSIGSTHAESIKMVAGYADTLRRVFDHRNFLFSYLKGRPDAGIKLDPVNVASRRTRLFDAIKKTFPDITKFNYQDIQVFSIDGNPDITSTWVWLPDNTLLLCGFLYNNWMFKSDWKPQFMGLDTELVKRHYPSDGYVAIHLDAHGKLIRDYGKMENVYFGL